MPGIALIWVVFSTSSPVASVALFVDGKAQIQSEPTDRNASGTSIRLLDSLLAEAGLSLSDVSAFGADVGPGSFTGVKVGVTLAKTFAYVHGKPCAGFSSFDLISPAKDVAIPCRKDLYLYRSVQNKEPILTASDDLQLGECVGYGKAFDKPQYPDTGKAPISAAVLVKPEELVPNYVLEPSISTPKKPYRQVLE